MADLPQDLIHQVHELVERHGRDLVAASLPQKRRGRPKGSGIDDRAALYRMGKLIYADPELSVSRAAFQSLHLTEAHSPGSAARRLRRKFQVQRSNWLGAMDAVVHLDRLVEEIGPHIEALRVSSPLSLEDRAQLAVWVSTRDTLVETARHSETAGPEEAVIDMWLVAHALDEKWAVFFSKRPFVRRKNRAD